MDPLNEEETREACRVDAHELEVSAHVLAHAMEDTIKDFRDGGLLARGDSIHVSFVGHHILASAEYRARWGINFFPAVGESHSEYALTLELAVEQMKRWLEINYTHS